DERRFFQIIVLGFPYYVVALHITLLSTFNVIGHPFRRDIYYWLHSGLDVGLFQLTSEEVELFVKPFLPLRSSFV
ncbi:hypothetical protein PanWU01x14_368100, partial [Parasponia andersonii]